MHETDVIEREPIAGSIWTNTKTGLKVRVYGVPSRDLIGAEIPRGNRLVRLHVFDVPGTLEVPLASFFQNWR